jgi:hypothetical protein
LAQFVTRLNEHLLAPSLEVVEAIRLVRSRLVTSGADLEEAPSIEAMEIHIRDR